MAKLEWEESWSVGDDSLDSDHQALVNIINRVIAAQENQQPTDWVLQDLSEYVDYHFSREEGMMESAGYEDLDAHKREHQMFVEWLSSVRTTWSQDPQSRYYLADIVNGYLQKWLKEHIFHTDMAYKGQL